MARNTSISLGEHFSDFISTQVDAGRYNSASDVVRAGLAIAGRARDKSSSSSRGFNGRRAIRAGHTF